MSMQEVALILVWIPPLFYLFSTIPQHIKNYRFGSAKGLSKSYVLLFYLGAMTSLMYVYLMRLPLAYKVVAPLNYASVSFLVWQVYLYEDKLVSRRKVLAVYLIITGVGLGFLFIGFSHPLVVGGLAGWTSNIALGIYQLPQIVKIWRQGHTIGYSLLSVLLAMCAILIELAVAYVLRLPLQTTVNGLRNFTFRAIQLIQFWRYRKKKA